MQPSKPGIYTKDRGKYQPALRGSQGGGGYFNLPTPNPIQYFNDADKRVLKSELLDDKAKEWATSFLSSGVKLKTTQLRRFYDEIKAIERKILMGKDIADWQNNFERDHALIVMFKAKALYAEKRKNAPREFSQFIFDHVASLKDFRDFQAFIKVFEAVVAFHKYFSDDK